MTINLKKSDFSFKNNLAVFANIFGLVRKSFFRNPRGPLFMFVVPIFFMIMFFAVIGNNASGGMALYAYMLLPSMTILTSLAPAIVEWKNSVFLKRIDTTGVKKGVFIAALWVFYLLVSIVALVIMLTTGLLVSLIITPPLGRDPELQTFVKTMSMVNWGAFIGSSILVSLTSIGLATLLGGLFNSDGALQGVVMMIYFFSIFFSGIMLPPEVIESSKGMIIFTYFIPHKYSVFLFLFATQGAIAQGWDSSFNNHIGIGRDFTATWQPVLGALLIITALFLITAFTFKWTAKK
ncbi:ABC transporter ATP-binding protein [Spiroplasma sabaudiense Ar-1343]|uniref:ABC transporter ATP-binding protein n=1 Tax=Spiroplasma sabaudiense Ar-1343 TaxID=1276257 RepID=W6A8V9_9MOLU|nr:ABC transporter permease [Spiroplasma sabaudiense]AHI53452.1 ABC transporter ATP-binding protein [Spiroplasma sabaudiense Ar-1343]